jgi:hypothetical protein
MKMYVKNGVSDPSFQGLNESSDSEVQLLSLLNIKESEETKYKVLHCSFQS